MICSPLKFIKLFNTQMTLIDAISPIELSIASDHPKFVWEFVNVCKWLSLHRGLHVHVHHVRNMSIYSDWISSRRQRLILKSNGMRYIGLDIVILLNIAIDVKINQPSTKREKKSIKIDENLHFLKSVCELNTHFKYEITCGKMSKCDKKNIKFWTLLKMVRTEQMELKWIQKPLFSVL